MAGQHFPPFHPAYEPRLLGSLERDGPPLHPSLACARGFIKGTPQEKAEIEYQVQRLSHHPSIAMWDGCNECGGGGLYQTFAMPTVARVDTSRPIWPSCPAPGWESGVDRLSSRPNGGTLVTGAGGDPASPRPGGYPFDQEGHGPYTAFMRANVEAVVMPKAQIQSPIDPVDEVNDPTAVPAWTGPGEEGWYRSEFGCVSWSSFESMSAQMSPDQWGMQTPVGSQRNWSPENIINVFFGPAAAAGMAKSGEAAFKRQLYQSLVGQALFLKTEIEGWRSQNVFGTTIWMYNEMWPTGGWGSIEYGPGSGIPGQIPGGRWKPLHYQFAASTFADQMSTCNTAGACFVTNDSPFPFSGTVTVRLVNLARGTSTDVSKTTVALGPGAGVTKWFCGTEAPSPAQAAAAGEKYAKHANQIPLDRNSFVSTNVTTESGCEAACDSMPKCVGFTRESAPDSAPTTCWMYDAQAALVAFPGASWWQKPGTKPIPIRPAPPAPPGPRPANPAKPPPPQLECASWSATEAWKTSGCDSNAASVGSDCTLVVETLAATGSGAQSVALNVLPFQPPKTMKLPATTVTATVGKPAAAVPDQVRITLTAPHTAMFVVLTTAAEGRFSQNMVLVEAGKPLTIPFMSWNGAFDETSLALLKSSLRVEHLVDNL